MSFGSLHLSSSQTGHIARLAGRAARRRSIQPRYHQFTGGTDQRECSRTKTKSVLSALVVTATPVSLLLADRISVWNGSCVSSESPTVIFPFRTVRDLSIEFDR